MSHDGALPVTLRVLLLDAPCNAGSDLVGGSEGERQRVGVSGTRPVVWILPSDAGKLPVAAWHVLLPDAEKLKVERLKHRHRPYLSYRHTHVFTATPGYPAWRLRTPESMS
jgi:hypothetical protein